MSTLSSRAKNLSYASLLVVLATISSGCVTETSGGLPQPASPENRVQAQLDLARAYLTQNNLKRARVPLEKALEMDPKSVEGHVLSAILTNAENDYDLAEFHYKTALKNEPRNAQALNNYGTFLYSRGRFADAVIPLTKLVQDTGYRARAQAFENLGLTLLRLNRTAEAEDAFLRALDLNFRQAKSTLELAHLAFDRGEVKLASSRLLEYKTMARQNARSLCLGLKVATATGDRDQIASLALALNNLYPEQAGQCQVKS